MKGRGQRESAQGETCQVIYTAEGQGGILETQRRGGSSCSITSTTLIFSSSPFISQHPTFPIHNLWQPNQHPKMVRTNSNSSSDADIDIKPTFKNLGSKHPGGKANGVWTGNERKLLFDYVEKNGAGNWTAAAVGVPGKTAKQVRCRSFYLLIRG